MLLHFGLSAIHPSSSSRFKFNRIILMHHLGAHCPWPPRPQFQEGRCTPYYIPALDDTRVGTTRLFHSRCPVNATPQPGTITGAREGHRALQSVSALFYPEGGSCYFKGTSFFEVERDLFILYHKTS